jgi:phosphoribosyl-AMP cyclohydrolase
MTMELTFDHATGLLPAIVQAPGGGEVLMLGFMNRAAFDRTVATGYVTFFSRSRQTLWTKGETSGNRLRVVSIHTDCDFDALLVEAEVEGSGAVCHEGFRSCFFRRWTGDAFEPVGERRFDPARVYGAKADAATPPGRGVK